MPYDLSVDDAIINELQRRRQERENFNNNYQQIVNNFYAALNNNNKTTKNTSTNFENLVLTAATQIGKTEATINAILHSKSGTITVISCDNKNDQLSQMRTRLVSKGINAISVKKVNKKTVKQLVEDFRSQEKLTFLILNNGSQVEKLGRLLRDLLVLVTVTSYQVFYLENDYVKICQEAVDFSNTL